MPERGEESQRRGGLASTVVDDLPRADAGLHVDILLSDVIMPGLDGPAWVREAQKARPDVKVFFMSGYAEDAFVGGDSGIPNASFLPKPFTLNELTQRVKDQLGA